MNPSRRTHATAACLALLLSFWSMLAGGCAGTDTQAQVAREAKPGPLEAETFSAYLQRTRKRLEARRTDLKTGDRDKILTANLPFELQPDSGSLAAAFTGRYHRGLILVHDLNASPEQVRDLADYFSRRGWLVRALLLPGHGTRPSDLTSVGFAEWRAAVTDGVKTTAPLVDELYLGGTGLGAVLALDHVLEDTDKISGLFLFNPSLRPIRKHSFMAENFSLFKTWWEVRDEDDYAGYESIGVDPVFQLQWLAETVSREASRKSDRLRLPVFMAVSLEDSDVDSRYTLEFFRRSLTNTANRALVYSAERSPNLVPDTRMSVIESFIPVRKVLSFSHLSLTTAADNAHYGERGDYHNCLHYRSGSAEFDRCRAGEARWLGEVTPANLETGLLQRLTWNPRFDFQCEELDRFLNRLGS